MGNPYLNRDESIILTTHNVFFNSIVTEVILTNQRLIFFDSGHAQLRYQTIPLATIETVLIREDNQGNPVIFLSISPLTPDSPPQSRELTFSRQTTGDRKQECEMWVKQLKEQIILIRQQAISTTQPVSHHETDIIFEDISTKETDQVPSGETIPLHEGGPAKPLVNTPLTWREADIGSEAVLPDTIISPEAEPGVSSVHDSSADPKKDSLSSRFHPPSDQPSRPKLIAVTVIIVILAIVAGAFIYSMILPGTTSEPPVPQVTPSIVPVITAISNPTMPQNPTPQTTRTLTATPTPAPMIPEKGVWVRVQYAGNFIGRVGTSGNLNQVNATGDQYYQVPINDGIVEVVIQKQDGSGDILTVEIYQNGRLVTRSTKATPYGTIDIHETVKRGNTLTF
jgi:hypothetical protein